MCILCIYYNFCSQLDIALMEPTFVLWVSPTSWQERPTLPPVSKFTEVTLYMLVPTLVPASVFIVFICKKFISV
jgi:hypothetical protein